jgi:helicase-exonuclease AddAB, AddA subunit, Firmicutes type
MGQKWTEEQEKAIHARDCSLLVAAAAGAGKTAVLVERIIQKIMDTKNPVDIDKLLVVTFTNAAASEMRERIGDAISAEIEKSPGSVRLQRQIALLNRASITTIHSFCLDVIRNNFHLIDLDPAFRIADETESVLLKQEALTELFDGEYEDENSNSGFLNLVECYGGRRDDQGLMDMVLRLYEFSRSTPWPEEWIRDMAEMFNSSDFESTPWAKVLMKDVKTELTGACGNMEKAVKLLEGAEGLESYYNQFTDEYRMLRSLCENCASWDVLYGEFNKINFDRLSGSKKNADKDIQNRAKAIRDDVKKTIKCIKDGIMTSNSSEIAGEMKSLYPAMSCLGELTLKFAKKYGEKKKDRGVIDFSDIEHFCVNILVAKAGDGGIIPSDAALKLREKFDEILIDEYQDSNMVQELILSTISRKERGKPNMFMVGDVKQSIYRFRQAKPELFLQKYNTYPDEDTAVERRILLYKNFRSRKEVLSAVNYIFKGIMTVNIGELDYTEKEKLNPGADYEDIDSNPVEVHLIETASSEEEDSDGTEEEAEDGIEDEDIDNVQLEARAVAARINQIVHSNDKPFLVFDKSSKSYRPVQFRDIVILMRATSSAAPVFVEELANTGIPAFADAGGGYFEVVEVQTVMSLLQIIDNPMQDIPLLSVLRSPIVSFTPEDLIDIRMADGRKTFYEALKIKSSSDDDTGKKAAEFLQNLKRWRQKALNMPISEFIWFLYSDTGYYAYAGAMPGGMQRQANLRILFERARQYEETSFKGLFNFINFINKLKSSSGDMGSAKILGENENVVRIMSIHKSKGLEFPVVFVSGAGRKFNMKDLTRSILFHHELGFGPDYVDSVRRISYPTVIKEALKRKIRLESLSEEMRILYVAFTRAREKLIITGTVRNMEKALSRWAACLDSTGDRVPEYQVLSGGNFFDWICPMLMKHIKNKDFREASGVMDAPYGTLVDDESGWDIRFYRRRDVLLKGTAIEDGIAGDESATGVEGSRYEAEIDRRLRYEYPYRLSSKLPAKLSVTELKRMFGTMIDDEYTTNIFVPPLIKKPSYLEGESRLSAAEKGTVMHLVMQHVDISKAPTIEDINSLLQSLVASEFMTVQQQKTVDIGRILSFFESPLGRRMIKSGKVKREIPFYMKVDSTDVYKDLPDDKYRDEKIVLQGIIDCCFEEDDGLVLIDYKTDYVPVGEEESIRERYRLQIEYYEKALRKITGKTVKEKYIYLFHNREVLKY